MLKRAIFVIMIVQVLLCEGSRRNAFQTTYSKGTKPELSENDQAILRDEPTDERIEGAAILRPYHWLMKTKYFGHRAQDHGHNT